MILCCYAGKIVGTLDKKVHIILLLGDSSTSHCMKSKVLHDLSSH